MMMRGKELLASDRLSQLAGKESRTMDGAKRTSEALTWLDRRLDADLAATQAGAHHAANDAETPEPSRAETEAALRDIMPAKSKAELLREKIERRGMPDEEGKSLRAEFTSSGRSYLSSEAAARLDRIKEGHQVWQDEQPAGKRDHDMWADQAHRERASLVHVRPFPDLSATSKAARASAAPHIAGIYDQIFVDHIDDTCGEPDREPIVDRFQDCTLILDETWDTVEGAEDQVGGDNVGRRSHYERRLTQNLADCLQVPLHRVKVCEMRPGPSWYRVQELRVDLTLLPDAGGHPPTCKELVERLQSQAKAHDSLLRSRMPAVRVEQPDEAEDMPYHAADTKPLMSFSFLRGGIVEDTHDTSKRASHGFADGKTRVNSALLARDHITSAPQHVQYMVQQVLIWCMSAVAVSICAAFCVLNTATLADAHLRGADLVSQGHAPLERRASACP